jgi:hypothetical protein
MNANQVRPQIFADKRRKAKTINMKQTLLLFSIALSLTTTAIQSAQDPAIGARPDQFGQGQIAVYEPGSDQ